MPLPRIDPGHYQGRQTARCLARQHDLETQIVPSRALGPEGASSGYRGEMVLHAEPEESGGAAQGTRKPRRSGAFPGGRSRTRTWDLFLIREAL